MPRKLEVAIVGDSRSLERAFGRSARSASTFNSALRSTARVAVIAGAALAGGFVVALKRGFDELAESQKVTAQTAAGIKSTGGAAKVTAKHVAALAESLSRMSGVDDELIQQSENLLLTFKRVRNEVGTGGKVFDRATAAALDLSVRGFGSVDSAAKQLGKALSDPVKGMGALKRAGVDFTDAQKRTIAALVESGNLLAAQKLILKEVEGQVGGSAKAYGETLPGQLAKARNAFDEIAAEVAVKFLPALTSALQWVNAHWPQISAVMDAVAEAIIVSVTAVSKVLREHVIPAVEAVVAVVREHWPEISRIVSEVFGATKSIVLGVVAVVQAVWNRFGGALTEITVRTFNTLKQIIGNAFRVVQGIFEFWSAIFHGQWGKAWDALKKVWSNALEGLWTLLRGSVGNILTAAGAIGGAILSGIVGALRTLVDVLGTVRDGFAWIGANAVAIWKRVKTELEPIVTGLTSVFVALLAVVNSVKDAIAWIIDKAQAAIDLVKKIPNPLGGIPGFQHGGTMRRSGVALVGEAGPELVRLPGRAQVIPNRSLAGAGGGGGLTVNVYPQGHVLTERDLVKMIRDAIIRQGRTTGGSLFGGYA